LKPVTQETLVEVLQVPSSQRGVVALVSPSVQTVGPQLTVGKSHTPAELQLVARQVVSVPQGALQQRPRQTPELHSPGSLHSSPAARLPQLPPVHLGEPAGQAVVLVVLVQVPVPSQVFSTMPSPLAVQTLGGQVVPAAW
jgi:hypothetical protein